VRKKKPENLTIPGMKARSFPNKAKQVDMSAWKDIPLYRASVRAEVEKAQGALFEKPAGFRCEQKCPGCGVTFSPSVEICPVEVFDNYKLGIDLDYDEYDILQRRREKDQGLRQGGESMGTA
jgi:hypothetical protein